MPSPAPTPADRLVLTVRTSAERHADGEYHARLYVDGAFALDVSDNSPEDARRYAIGQGLRAIGVDLCTGDRCAPTAIDIVDVPESEGR